MSFRKVKHNVEKVTLDTPEGSSYDANHRKGAEEFLWLWYFANQAAVATAWSFGVEPDSKAMKDFMTSLVIAVLREAKRYYKGK